MAKKITWSNSRAKLSELKEWDDNPRQITDRKYRKLVSLMKKFGFTSPVIVNKDMTIIAGHQRKKGQVQLNGEEAEVDIRVPNRQLSPEEMAELAVGDNLFSGVFDYEKLKASFDPDRLLSIGFEKTELNLLEKLQSPKKSGDPKEVQVSFTARPKYPVTVICEDEANQQEVYDALIAGGYKLKPLTTK